MPRIVGKDILEQIGYIGPITGTGQYCPVSADTGTLGECPTRFLASLVAVETPGCTASSCTKQRRTDVECYWSVAAGLIYQLYRILGLGFWRYQPK